MNKALLFINGQPPADLPETSGYQLIACTDGAFHYLKEKGFPFEKLDFLSGDFDSHHLSEHNFKNIPEFHAEIIHTPNQDQTDFEKALDIIFKKGFEKVDVYGASGGEMDHFLGNLTVAYKFKEKMEIIFFDNYSTYFFASNNLILNNVKGNIISLYPFPKTVGIVSRGLNWELENTDLDQHSRVSTRNYAVSDDVSITFTSGDLLIFIGKKYHLGSKNP